MTFTLHMYNSGHLGIWKMYLCILKLSFCGFLSKILPLHLTLLSVPHSPSSVPFRQEDCASYLRFSHWLRPSLGENKQTQKQETHLVLISSYGYRLFQFLPGLHCFPMPSDDCSFFFFFLFLKFIVVVYKRVVLIEATSLLLETEIEFQQ